MHLMVEKEGSARILANEGAYVEEQAWIRV
jgi:hypothetical protein